MPKTAESVSIVIPTYNEARNLSRLLYRIHESMKGRQYEIIVVDDGSPDGTAQEARALSASYPLHVVERGGKKGLASAVVDGFSTASGAILGFMDADLSHPPEVLPDLIDALEEDGVDIVVASRLVAGGGVAGNWPEHRKLNSYVATVLAKPLTSVRDCMSGCFFLRKDVIDGVTLIPRGYKIGLEILVKGNYRAAKEVPILFDNRSHGESKLTAKVQLEYLIQILDLYRYRFIQLFR